MRLLTALFLIGSFFVSAAHAQSEPLCVQGNDHFIAVANNMTVLNIDQLGDSIAIYPNDADQDHACVFDKASASHVFEGTYSYEAAIDEFLILNEASALDHLHIIDMNTGEHLLDTIIKGRLLSSNEVVYWEVREAATPETCSDYELFKSYGGSSVMTYEVRYSFETRQSTETGRSVCEYEQ